MDESGDLEVAETAVMRLVAPWGFYGAGNIGDEATLNGFAQLLSQNGIAAHVSVGSRNPSHNARVEPAFHYFDAHAPDPRRWMAKMRGNAQAIIGGTPIMDIEGEWPLNELTEIMRAVDRWKVPMAFVGIGTETLRSLESKDRVAREIVPRVRHWSVRCDRDRERLIDCGVSSTAITVAADMAWLIDEVTDGFGRERLHQWGISDNQPIIGVNVVNETGLFQRRPKFVTELAEALDRLSSQINARIVFLANEVRGDMCFDTAAASEIARHMKRAEAVFVAPAQYLSPHQMMSLIACCDLTISMRYHFCMFSALQGIPFVAIERSDKLADLCWDMEWSARTTPSTLVNLEIVEHVERLRHETPALRIRLKQCVERMRKRAHQNVVALNSLGLTGDIAGRRPLLAC